MNDKQTKALDADIRHARLTPGSCINHGSWTVIYGGVRTPFDRFYEFAVWFAWNGDGTIHYATTGANVGTVNRVDMTIDTYPVNGINLLLLSPKQRTEEIDNAARLLFNFLDELAKGL